MKIADISFFPHRLKRKYRWQTASYTADSVQVFYVKLQGENRLTGLGATSVMPKEDVTFQPGIVVGFEVVGGAIRVPDGPGLGVGLAI